MTKQTLQQQIANGVREQLAAMGFTMATDAPSGAQTDHIAFGSDKHRQLVGLVKVEEGDDVSGYTTFPSPYSDNVYRLEDELGVVNLYPGVDPDKAAVLMLRQKINVLEGGIPEPPANAPSMWTPVATNMTLLQRGI